MNKERDGELVALLQDLVKIPSWVPDDPSLKTQQNENEVVDYLEKETFSKWFSKGKLNKA